VLSSYKLRITIFTLNDYPQKLLKFQINYFGALHLPTKGQSPDILVENTSRKSPKVQRTEI